MSWFMSLVHEPFAHIYKTLLGQKDIKLIQSPLSSARHKIDKAITQLLVACLLSDMFKRQTLKSKYRVEI